MTTDDNLESNLLTSSLLKTLDNTSLDDSVFWHDSAMFRVWSNHIVYYGFYEKKDFKSHTRSYMYADDW